MNIHPSIPAILIFLALTACGVSPTPDSGLSTASAISVELTEGQGYCPSVEVQAGMQITWTNIDDANRMLIIERMNEEGIVVNSGGTDLLQPGTTFSIILTEAGEYTYYCSLDRAKFGAIHVRSNSTVPVRPLQ